MLCLALLTVPLFGDSHVVMKLTVGGQESMSDTYSQDNRFRSEENGLVFIRSQGSNYVLNLKTREYAENKPTAPGKIALIAGWLARPPRVINPEKMVGSMKTIDIYYEVIDTGERKLLLGETAKHFVTKTRYVPEPGAFTKASESEKDGWYLSALPSQGEKHVRVGAYITMSHMSVDWRDKIVQHGRSIPPGFPVVEHDGEMTRELLQYSTAPLDASLFAIPADFKKVDRLAGVPGQLTWTQQFEMEWGQLEGAVQSWFD